MTRRFQMPLAGALAMFSLPSLGEIQVRFRTAKSYLQSSNYNPGSKRMIRRSSYLYSFYKHHQITSSHMEPILKPVLKPKGHLLLHNIGKRNNIGSIIRTACAFNLNKIFYIGKKEGTTKAKTIKDFSFFGNKGTLNKTQFFGFNNLKDAKEYFKTNGMFVCGVEIGEGSEPIQTHPFKGETVFFMGNEGTGLLPVHRQICDHFVYIPQYSDKTASLNVGVAAGIIFHNFAIWAGYEEAEIFGEKFKDVKEGPEQIEGGSDNEDVEQPKGEQEQKTQQKTEPKTEQKLQQKPQQKKE